MKKKLISSFRIIILLLIVFNLNGCREQESGITGDPINNNNMTVYNTQNGLPDNFVSSIFVEKFENREILWIGTWNGLVKYDFERWINYTEKDGLTKNHITDIISDSQSRLWVSSISLKKDGGVSVYDGRDWKSYSNSKQDTDDRPGNIITLKEDSAGNIWAGSWGNGVYKFDGENWMNFNTTNGLPSNEIMDIIEFDEKVWFATKQKGAFYKSIGKDDDWEIVDEHSSNLINNSICSLAKDDSKLWFGTWGGVSSLSIDDKWEKFTTFGNKLADLFVRVIHMDEKNVYFGTDKGVTIYDGENWTTITTKEGLPSDKILSIASTKNDIWIGTDKGLVQMNKE